MNNKLTLAFLLCVLSFSLFGQPIGQASYDTKIQLGGEALAINDYIGALEHYEAAYEEREDETLLPILAEINYQLLDYRAAERSYKRLLRRDAENVFLAERYKYGRVLKMQGKYDEARQELQQVIDNTDDAGLKQMAQTELAGCELGTSMSDLADGVTVEALDRGKDKVNGRKSEYTPALSPDGSTLYFAALNGDEVFDADDPNDPEKYARIFMSSITEDGYSKRTVLGPEINRPGYHSVNVSLSPDGTKMYFNRVLLEGNKPAESTIYMSEGGSGSWQSANPVEGVNGEYQALHPAAGELFGSEVLYFSSDMDGGYGGMDLYYATYEGDGKYSDPVNLGETVNTAGDEMTPWWYDGTLYYSTDGLPSLGGLDIYYSVWNGSEWSDPANMGKAYNSSADDLSFRLFDEGYKGFFTSNRPEGRSAHGKTCCDDIYGFEIARMYANLTAGTVIEGLKGEAAALIGATVQLIPLGGELDGTQSKTNDKTNGFNFALELEKQYLVVATHPDYFPDSVTFNTLGLEESTNFQEFLRLSPKPIPPTTRVVEIENPIVMENILYDFDDDKITEQAEIDLQIIFETMTEHEDMKVELGSHTDVRGEDEYNRDLSQRRAESARRWLMRKGIARDRIAAVGYGETVPKVVSEEMAATFAFMTEGDILTEEYINALEGEEQQEEAHQQNRRTEFKITEGPTSVIIRREEVIDPSEAAPDRGSNIGASQSNVEIHKFSTLYGQTDLSGLPIMQFENRIHNVGTVIKGEQRSFEYAFKNVGEGDMIIDLVSACDCTTTNQDDFVGKTFKPGEGGILKVTFDSSDKEESETIDIDIYLRNDDNKGDMIYEMVRYNFDM